MTRRVVSVVRSDPASLRRADPALEVNAYAVCEAVELAVVLAEGAVELAVALADAAPNRVAGIPVSTASAANDLRALLESGIPVLVDEAGLRAAGLTGGDLVSGVEVADAARVAQALRTADTVLAW